MFVGMLEPLLLRLLRKSDVVGKLLGKMFMEDESSEAARLRGGTRGEEGADATGVNVPEAPLIMLDPDVVACC